MATALQGLAHIADQRPGDHRRKGSPDNDAALGGFSLDVLKVDEADKPDEVLPELDVDALDEMTGDNRRLGHSQEAPFVFGHRPYPFTSGDDRRAQAHVEGKL